MPACNGMYSALITADCEAAFASSGPAYEDGAVMETF